MVSFCAPQSEPARALRMLRREVARETMSEMWGEKVKWVSKVTPRIFVDLERGRSWLFRKI